MLRPSFKQTLHLESLRHRRSACASLPSALPTPAQEGMVASGWQRTDLAGSCAAPMGIFIRSGFVLLAKLSSWVLGVVCNPTAREKPKCRAPSHGTAGLPERCSCRSAPWALTNVPGRTLPPTGDGKGLHANAVNNVHAGPCVHGPLAKDKGAL